ncbi:hypothetical protein ABK040_003000 [Willaertia magna]
MKNYLLLIALLVVVLALSSTVSVSAAKEIEIMKNVETANVELKPFCDVCVMLATTLEQYVNQSEPQIINQLDNICDKMGGALDGICKVFVSLYGKQLVDLLLQKLPPKQACCKLTLCDCQQQTKIMNGKVIHQCIKNNRDCKLCTKMMNTMRLQHYENEKLKLHDNGALENLFEKTCQSFEEEKQQERCYGLLIEMSSKFLSHLVIGTKSETACRDMNYCKV